jgi:cob(I)alamin adenosyltransferase
MNKIYTKTGDQGMTHLGTGEKITKASLRVNACGAIDELNAFLGLALVYIEDPILQKNLYRIQQQLLTLNSQLALASPKKTLTMQDLQNLEHEIDEMNSKLKPLTKFIAPGGNLIAAHLHVARTVCRRAERALVKLSKQEDLDKILIPYLNRLSDWLFVAARLSNI